MLLRVKDDPSTVVSETFSEERMAMIVRGILTAKSRLRLLHPVAQIAHDRAHDRFQAILEAQLAQFRN